MPGPPQEGMLTQEEMTTQKEIATQDDAAESRLNPERPSQLTWSTPKTVTQAPPRWCHDPYTLFRTLCRLSFIRLPHFQLLALSENLGRYLLPDSRTIPLNNPGPLNLPNLTLPCFSPNPICPSILPVSPQIRRRCRRLSHQEPSPPCLPIHAVTSIPPTRHLSRPPPP